MTFTKIENYCGEKGYLKNTTIRLEAIEKDGSTYLIGPGLDVAYRVIRVNEDFETAVATQIKNPRKIRELESIFIKETDDLV